MVRDGQVIAHGYKISRGDWFIQYIDRGLEQKAILEKVMGNIVVGDESVDYLRSNIIAP
jgi:hypothetical protein